MTAQMISVMDDSTSAGNLPRTVPSFGRLWASSLLVYLLPRRCGALWLDASLLRAALVAALNCLFGLAWLFLVAVAQQAWDSAASSSVSVRLRWDRVIRLAEAIPGQIAANLHLLPLLERAVLAVALLSLIAIAFVLPFFILLPFAARPGPAKPCVRHVSRTVLLATGGLHLWGIAYVSVFFVLAATMPAVVDQLKEAQRGVSPILLTGTALGLWTLASLIAAIRLDYRRQPGDQPQPHDPSCDDCGYNLIAAAPAGRCPECGRLVADSLGVHTRPPTPWEQNPSATNFPVIVRQLRLLVRHPRRLFFSMPTLTGQRAAQRWLLLSMLVIAAAAFLIVPAIVLTNGFEWSAAIFCGSLAMAFAWALLAIMMVGIETAGVATVSRMRARRDGADGIGGRGVYLAAAAKVTCYSSILMVVWVLTGGAQLVIAFPHLEHMVGTPTMSLWAKQIVLATSLSIAHIGGLFWYEFTVYRGIRAVQYANK